MNNTCLFLETEFNKLEKGNLKFYNRLISNDSNKTNQYEEERSIAVVGVRKVR